MSWFDDQGIDGYAPNDTTNFGSYSVAPDGSYATPPAPPPLPVDTTTRGPSDPATTPTTTDPTTTATGTGTKTGVPTGPPTSLTAGSYAVQPVDPTKWANPNYVDPKYAFLKVESQYDPTKGITQAELDQLNSLGYGTFAANDLGGDKSFFTPSAAGIAAGLNPTPFDADIIYSSGGPGAHWQYDWFDPNAGATPATTAPPAAAPAASPSGGTPGVGGGAPPNVLTTSQFQPFQYQNFSYAPFTPPSPTTVTNDPGYAFGLSQGLGALTASQAAQGISKTGGAAKGLIQYGNDYATTKYDDAYQRALNSYQTNFGTAYQTNQANNSGNLGAFTANTNAALGFGNLGLQGQSIANQYSLGLGQLALGNLQANQNYALGQGNLGLGYYTAGNNFALGQGQLGLGYYTASNQNALNQNYYGLAAQGQQFNQGLSLSELGIQASNNLGTSGSNFASGASNTITGAGSAAAAGTVGSANAWSGAYGTIGSYGSAALPYGLYYGTGGGQPPYAGNPTYGASSPASGYGGGW